MAYKLAYDLEASMDISVVEKLHDALKGLTGLGDNVKIGASNIERIDTTVFQLLYSYQQSMKKNHVSVSFVQPSTIFIDNSILLGVNKLLNIEN